MKTIFLAFIAIAFMTGCSSTYRMTPLDYRRFENGDFSLVMFDGTRHAGNDLILGGDSIFVRGDDSAYTLARRNVRSIESLNRGQGAVEGLIVGGLVGGVTWLTLYSSNSNGDEPFRGVGSVLSAAAGFIVGGGAGTIVGLIKGHHDTYEFIHDSLTTTRAGGTTCPVITPRSSSQSFDATIDH